MEKAALKLAAILSTPEEEARRAIALRMQDLALTLLRYEIRRPPDPKRKGDWDAWLVMLEVFSTVMGDLLAGRALPDGLEASCVRRLAQGRPARPAARKLAKGSKWIEAMIRAFGNPELRRAMGELQAVRLGKKWMLGKDGRKAKVTPLELGETEFFAWLRQRIQGEAADILDLRDPADDRAASRRRAADIRRKRGVMPRQGKAPSKRHLPSELPKEWQASIKRASKWRDSEHTSVASPTDRARAGACEYLLNIPSGRSRPKHGDGYRQSAEKWSVGEKTLGRAVKTLRNLRKPRQT